jgi:succinate dehydrogenase/fumarate reductase flavoprotein subunit
MSPVDIVIIGHGAAGLCAALAAAETARERGISVRITVVKRAPEAEPPACAWTMAGC